VQVEEERVASTPELAARPPSRRTAGVRRGRGKVYLATFGFETVRLLEDDALGEALLNAFATRGRGGARLALAAM
jgi:hypothetical protein